MKKIKKYRVSVLRMGFANRDIEVEASTPTEAKKKALEDAGNYDYSEHSSEYNVVGIKEREV